MCTILDRSTVSAVPSHIVLHIDNADYVCPLKKDVRRACSFLTIVGDTLTLSSGSRLTRTCLVSFAELLLYYYRSPKSFGVGELW